MTPGFCASGFERESRLTDGTIDHMSVLVRVILYFASGRRVEVDSGAHHTTGP